MNNSTTSSHDHKLAHAKALLFDLDGTLTDPAEGITGCIAYALTRLGIPVPPMAELRSYIGPSLYTTFGDLLLRHSLDAKLVSDAVALYRERFVPIGMYENAVYPGIPEALSELRAAGRTLYVATSKPVVFASEIVRHFGLAQYFQAVYGSELTGERTDKAELIAYVLEREGISPDQAVMIGDRRHDIEGGRANQLHGTIGVTYGYGGAVELLAAGADHLCDAPASLPVLLLDNPDAHRKGTLTPCINVCTLNSESICMGCGRTLDEIANWMLMTDGDRLTIMQRTASTPKPERAANEQSA